MSSVSQLVPNYVLGISDQPDELKRPGQVRQSLNTFPDVTFGLTKRPGLDFKKTLTLPLQLDGSTPDDGNGTWFNYFRSNAGIGQEEYFGYVTTEGKVKMWSAKTGTEMKVSYLKSLVPAPPGYYKLRTPLPKFPQKPRIYNSDMVRPGDPGYDDAYIPYLTQRSGKKPIRTLTVNDYTFLTNREVPVSMSGTKSDLPGNGEVLYEAFVDIRTLAYNRDYTLLFNEPDSDPNNVDITTATQLTLIGESYPTRTTPCYAGTETKTLSLSSGDATGLRVNFRTGCQSIASEGPDGYWTAMSTRLTLLSGGTGWEVGDRITTTTSYGGTYVIEVKEIGKSSLKASLGVATVASATDATEKLSVASIIGTLPDPSADPAEPGEGLLKEIYEIGGWETIEQIGNGIYITRKTPFTVSTPEADLFNILSLNQSDSQTAYMAVDNIASLPTQCKHEVVCKVMNSGSDSDDYFVKFKGDLDQDGRGVWEETRQPGLDNFFSEATMPHQIIRLEDTTRAPDGEIIVEFCVANVGYDGREVGDEITNPRPSFAPKEGFNDDEQPFLGKTINNIMFFRNRLVLLSDENIIMSRPGDYFNFWAVSALTSSPKDPIDMSASTTYASVLYDGLGINNGLVLFSEFQQFLLTTDSDVLDNSTAKITPIGSWDFDPLGYPFHMGGTFGWIGTETNFSKFYEMADVFREGEPSVVENSTIIKKRFSTNLTEIAQSKQAGICMFSKKDAKSLFFFRFFDNGKERALASWSQWTLPHKLKTHFIIGDDYSVVLQDDSGNYQYLKLSIRSGFLGINSQGTPFIYPVAFDYKKEIEKARITYDSKTRTSAIPIDIPYYSELDFGVVSKAAGRYQTVDPSGGIATVTGDWTDADVFVGYNFDCMVQLPTFYVTQNNQQRVISQTTKDLIIHRAKFSFGEFGYYEVHLNRKGMDNYTFGREGKFADNYRADTDSVETTIEEIVPIYTRNTSFDITIESSHPSPFVLYSMTWEGDFNQRYYKSI